MPVIRIEYQATESYFIQTYKVANDLGQVISLPVEIQVDYIEISHQFHRVKSITSPIHSPQKQAISYKSFICALKLVNFSSFVQKITKVYLFIDLLLFYLTYCLEHPDA